MNKELKQRLTRLFHYPSYEIRKDKELLKEYIELHVIIEGNKPSCAGCSFNSKFNAWKRKFAENNIIPKPNKMENKVENTFILAKKFRKSAGIYVPHKARVINSNSPDDWVVDYLTETEVVGVNLEARKNMFEKLPDVMLEKEDDKNPYASDLEHTDGENSDQSSDNESQGIVENPTKEDDSSLDEPKKDELDSKEQGNLDTQKDNSEDERVSKSENPKVEENENKSEVTKIPKSKKTSKPKSVKKS